MPIHAPHAHLYNSVKLEVAKAKLSHAGRKSLYAPLNLVAYIDMMTMLVIFLLMSFSATGEILFVQKNIVLPDAQNWTDLERAPVIGVSKDVVTLDGSQVATADDLMKDSSTGDFKIAELHDKLVTLKNNYKLLHPGEEFNGIAIIQSDKNVEFKALKKVMYSIAVAGYQNVNFAVTPKAKGGGARRGSVARPAGLSPQQAGPAGAGLFFARAAHRVSCDRAISRPGALCRRRLPSTLWCCVPQSATGGTMRILSPPSSSASPSAAVACQGDPNDPMTWAKQLKNLRTQKEALDHLANMDVEKARPAVPGADGAVQGRQAPRAPARRWPATRTSAPSRCSSRRSTTATTTSTAPRSRPACSAR